MAIDLEKLYKDLTGLELSNVGSEPHDVTMSEVSGFKIPQGSTITHHPKGNPYDLFIEYHGSSIGINADGSSNIDVPSISGDVSGKVQAALNKYRL
ncbi:MAG: hypothetical protein KAJ91_04695 [Candidatus Aenigmarchaeota archaeon]|nr:hypothetical protein [Candidatus Aenigmarchaeota archaeon]